ncbi:MAG: hypothetical protein R3E95_22480 [Thiolinea sp.]
MAPRKRSLRNSDLAGSNIKTVKRSDGYAYYYIMPDKTLESLGKDRKQAIEAAHILNQHLRPSGDLASGIIGRAGKKISSPWIIWTNW